MYSMYNNSPDYLYIYIGLCLITIFIYILYIYIYILYINIMYKSYYFIILTYFSHV